MTSLVSFDLRSEPWIGVTDLGGRSREVGLREALCRAHEFADVADASPLVVDAVLRLLVAISHRVVDGPRDEATASALRAAGRFDPVAVDRYLEAMAGRFDLFHPTHPFLQVPGLAERGREISPMARLVPERAGVAKPVFFDHRLPGEVATAAEAARTLVAWQAFALCRAQAQWPGGAFRAAKDAPASRSAHAMVLGPTLYDTLVGNLVAYDPAAGIPHGTTTHDAPAWEREPLAGPAARVPDGLLDLLTWRSRAVGLVPAERTDGVSDITGVVEHDGETCVGDATDLPDPFVAFRRRANAREGQSLWLRVEVDEARAAWRDSLALLGGTATDDAGTLRRPAVLSFHARLAELGYADSTGLVPLALRGQATESGQNKVHTTRTEFLAAPVAALLDADRRDIVALAVTMAEAGDRALLRSGALAALLEPEAYAVLDSVRRKAVARAQRRRPAAVSFGGTGAYWASLDAPFRGLMAALAGVTVDPGRLIAGWRGRVERAARSAFADAISSFPTRPLATAEAETIFERALGRYLDELTRGGN